MAWTWSGPASAVGTACGGTAAGSRTRTLSWSFEVLLAESVTVTSKVYRPATVGVKFMNDVLAPVMITAGPLSCVHRKLAMSVFRLMSDERLATRRQTVPALAT